MCQKLLKNTSERKWSLPLFYQSSFLYLRVYWLRGGRRQYKNTSICEAFAWLSPNAGMKEEKVLDAGEKMFSNGDVGISYDYYVFCLRRERLFVLEVKRGGRNSCGINDECKNSPAPGTVALQRARRRCERAPPQVWRTRWFPRVVLHLGAGTSDHRSPAIPLPGKYHHLVHTLRWINFNRKLSRFLCKKSVFGPKRD